MDRRIKFKVVRTYDDGYGEGRDEVLGEFMSAGRAKAFARRAADEQYRDMKFECDYVEYDVGQENELGEITYTLTYNGDDPDGDGKSVVRISSVSCERFQNESCSKYTRRQIEEAVRYWSRKLNEFSAVRSKNVVIHYKK